MLTRISASSAARAPLCRACALRSHARPILAPTSPVGAVRHRTSYFIPPPPPSKKRNINFPFKQPPPRLTADQFKPPLPPSAYHIVQLLINRLTEYVGSERLDTRLADYGLDKDQRDRLVSEWEKEVMPELESVTDEESARMALARGHWGEENLTQSFSDGGGFAAAAEATLHRKVVSFAAAHPSLSSSIRAHLDAILNITDISRMAFRGEHIKARAMTRHFHLHIGPTNSGKTYNALKALAGAESGAYAGPLRLLAHEVWERINLGTVGGLDGQGKQCNLMTGEERRIVSSAAGLMSCTVEMLPLSAADQGYDVVVIDEIQMMGDVNRGGAWTRAVIGVCAKEVHLCGDETTVELLQNLIPTLGDTMTIHRYDRLTPLQVADESLNGDWDKVEPGDAVVTFSRNNIYAIKKQIEGIAAKKCAVIYGALPPETRADQARDFNDEDGRSEVLVASDAIGMGLNLKIKRVIFESLEKFNGKAFTPLSLTQIKQIAGRAGRFGMQSKKGEDDPTEDPVRPDEVPEPGGVVTTLHKNDLPILRAILPMQLPKIKRATLDIPFRALADVTTLLPPNTPYADVLDHLHNLVLLPPNMRAGDFEQHVPVAQVLEPYRDQLGMIEIDLFTLCPVNSRDPNLLAIFERIVRQYAEDGLVEIDSVFGSSRYLNMLDMVEATLATLPPLPPILGIGRRVLTPPIIVSSIPSLESLHKVLVMYIWLTFRLEVAFPERSRAVELKTRVEVVLDDCLARFPGLRNLKTHERGKDKDRQVAKWRKEHVAPNGTKKMPGAGGKGILWVEEAVVQRLRNKRVWQGAGVVPEERVLRERDGRGAPPPELIEDGSSSQRQRAAISDGSEHVRDDAEGAQDVGEVNKFETKKGGYRSWNKEMPRRRRLPERDFERIMDGRRGNDGEGQGGERQ